MAADLIRLTNVTKSYRIGDENICALADVSLTIASGDFVAIIGPSGSGKSTLANVIGGLDRPDKGEVTVAGIQLAKASDREISAYRNSSIGFVFQAFNLQPHLTAHENVAVPLLLANMKRKDRQDRARDCLAEVGLSDRLKHLPSQLSGGQRQRVSIARALANQPKIIIADEPTGNLDSHRGAEIIELLRTLNGAGITLIVITHDAEVADHASRQLVIHDGVVTERGAAA